MIGASRSLSLWDMASLPVFKSKEESNQWIPFLLYSLSLPFGTMLRPPQHIPAIASWLLSHPPIPHRLAAAFISPLHRHSSASLFALPAPQTSPPSLLHPNKPPSRIYKIVLEPADADAILRKLDGVDFDHQIITKGPKQILLHACWAKVQLLLEEGVTVTHLKASLTRHPDVFYGTSDEQLASIIRFLNSVGVTGQEVGKAIFRRPRLLRVHTENLECKVGVFENLGIDRKVLRASFTNSPSLMTLSVGKLKERTQYLRDIGTSEEGISKILCRNPRFFQLRLEDRVKPLVAYLQRCGLEGERLSKAIACHSSVFGYTHLTQSVRIRFFLQLGLKEYSSHFVRAFLWLSTLCLTNLQSKVDLLTSRGLSLSEIGHMVGQSPSILSLSDENLSKKIDYVVTVLKRDIKELVSYPTFFSYNLEKRIIPRFNALAEAKEQELHRVDNGLCIVGYKEQRFQDRLSKILSSTNKGNHKKRGPSKTHNAIFSTAY